MRKRATAPVEMSSNDIRVTRLSEIMESLKKYACAHRQELFQMSIESEDFVQDVIRNIFVRKGFESYDPKKCQGVLEGLVFNCAHRHLIDLKRRAYGSRLAPNGKPYVKISLETPLSEMDGDLTVKDTLVSQQDPSELLPIFRDAVPEEVIEEVVEDGIELTWRKLFNLSVSNTQQEISRITGIGVRKVYDLQASMKREYLLPAIAESHFGR